MTRRSDPGVYRIQLTTQTSHKPSWTNWLGGGKGKRAGGRTGTPRINHARPAGGSWQQNLGQLWIPRGRHARTQLVSLFAPAKIKRNPRSQARRKPHGRLDRGLPFVDAAGTHA